MWGFVIYFHNALTGDEYSKLIEVDGQFFNSDEEICAYALHKGLKLLPELGEGVSFSKLEFIYC